MDRKPTPPSPVPERRREDSRQLLAEMSAWKQDIERRIFRLETVVEVIHTRRNQDGNKGYA